MLVGLGGPRERVWVLQEEGVKLPFDLSGLTISTFNSTSDIQLEASLELCSKEIAKQWSDIIPRYLSTTSVGPYIADETIGVSSTLRSLYDKNESMINTLNNLNNDSNSVLQPPFLFDSENDCISTYSEALSLVKKRFWTTTLLSSSFWTKRDARILDANREMMKRLGSYESPDVRRLFLLEQAPQRCDRASEAKTSLFETP